MRSITTCEILLSRSYIAADNNRRHTGNIRTCSASNRNDVFFRIFKFFFVEIRQTKIVPNLHTSLCAARVIRSYLFLGNYHSIRCTNTLLSIDTAAWTPNTYGEVFCDKTHIIDTSYKCRITYKCYLCKPSVNT